MRCGLPPPGTRLDFPKGMEHEESEKAVAKVRRINNRWIVHGKLRDHANAYLDHLERTDPHRLDRSCEIAMELVHQRKWVKDPKPLFYAGLFSLARRREIDRYLGEHTFTRAVLLRVLGDREPPSLPSEEAERLVRTIAGIVSQALS